MPLALLPEYSIVVENDVRRHHLLINEPFTVKTTLQQDNRQVFKGNITTVRLSIIGLMDICKIKL